jgi:hypothetical protein
MVDVIATLEAKERGYYPAGVTRHRVANIIDLLVAQTVFGCESWHSHGILHCFDNIFISLSPFPLDTRRPFNYGRLIGLMTRLAVIVWRQFGDQEGKLLRYINPHKVLLYDVGLAVGIRENHVDDSSHGAAQPRRSRVDRRQRCVLCVTLGCQ